MTEPRTRFTVSDFQAVLFDLDGVITKTAAVHAAAWKQLFDQFLAEHDGPLTPTQRRPFDMDSDYRLYVDGKPRYDGVQSFLESRAIHLPLGARTDGPEQATIYGLGNKKDRYFDQALREKGVQVYPGTVRCLHAVRQRGMKTAVVSSSHHCREVLETAGLLARFDVRIDGHHISELKLNGKPAPDAFLEAARRLDVRPDHAIVVEDALVGVAAGRAGGFGLIIGIDHHDQADALRAQGADLVVKDLEELLPDFEAGG